MPSQQAPVPSCQATQALPPWPLTLRTDRPIPAVYRWLISGRHMLTKVKQTIEKRFKKTLKPFSFVFISRLLFCRLKLHYTCTLSSIPFPNTQEACSSLLTPKGSCSLSVFSSCVLAPSYVLYPISSPLSSPCLLLSPVVRHCNLSSPSLALFRALGPICTLSLSISNSAAPLVHNIHLPRPSLWTRFQNVSLSSSCTFMSSLSLNLPQDPLGKRLNLCPLLVRSCPSVSSYQISPECGGSDWRNCISPCIWSR